MDGRDLDSLLENPALRESLAAFSKKMLASLVARGDDRLTETLCLALTLGSSDEAARRLYLHPNTIRYRMRRAREILHAEFDHPKDRTALSLAAFV